MAQSPSQPGGPEANAGRARPGRKPRASAQRKRLLDMDHISTVSAQVENSLARFRRGGWEMLYREAEAYRTAVRDACAQALGVIIAGARDTTAVPKNLLIPAAIYYVNSLVLKSRVACAIAPSSDPSFADFFDEYQKAIHERIPRKKVFPKAFAHRGELRADHFITFLTEGKTRRPDLPIVLTIENGSKLAAR